MRIVASILLLYVYSVSSLADSQSDQAEKTACAYKCCPKPPSCQPICCTGARPTPLNGQTDVVKKLTTANETLAEAIKNLSDTNDTLVKKIESQEKVIASLTKKKEKETSPKTNIDIDSGGWLTFLAILIALSAYMSNLRWGLIQKIEQIKRRTGDFSAQGKYRAADFSKKRKKYQGMIKWISLTDFLLVASAWASIWLLFLTYLCAPFKWPETIAVLFFIFAAGAFSFMHAREWWKTINQ